MRAITPFKVIQGHRQSHLFINEIVKYRCLTTKAVSLTATKSLVPFVFLNGA